MLQGVIKDRVDIFLVSETKIDKSFPVGQFLIKGYSTPFRLDRNQRGGGLLLYVREDIPCKILNEYSSEKAIESFFVEINLRSKKWLLSCSYNPSINLIAEHLHSIGRGLDFYSSKYDNFIVLGDFNTEVSNFLLEQFCETYNLKSLIKVPTCFKSIENPSCIDLILTNHPKCFQHSDVYETGLSDFHKLTFTVLKTHFQKIKPRIIRYRDYKNFNNNLYKDELVKELSLNNIQPDDLNQFITISKHVLQMQAPIKEKHVRYNQAMFMNKPLQKAIMNRSRLLNKYRKKKTEETKLAYKKQRNFCVKLLRKTKKEFYNNLNVKCITDNKLFWKTVKPSFTDKTLKDERITLVEKNEVISDDIKLVKIFSEYFGNIVQNLGIDNLSLETENVTIESAIEKYKNHPSIKIIQENIDPCRKFSFDKVNAEYISKIIDNLDTSKASQQGDIPTHIMKDNKDLYSNFISENFNSALDNGGIFPDQLKYADIKPVYKKDSRNDKKNYRPVSILPNLSKIYERCMHDQLSSYFDKLLSKFQFGFRKGFSTQQCLIAMIEKLRKSLDNGGASAALLTDLSKAFDCLPHDLLIAKLHAYGVDEVSLNFLLSYLTNRKQRVRINNTYSKWMDILFGVPQGSILGPLLFNIFLCDLFLFVKDVDIASYADDNTPFSTGLKVQNALTKLENAAETLLKWFKDNQMKANPDKYHLLVNNSKDSYQINIGNETITSSKCEKLLGIKIDHELNFNEHVTSLCKKASQKLNALSRLASSMTFDQRKLILNSFIISNFSYCPIVWMFHSRKLNERINYIHERALRIVYRDFKSSFQELLVKDNSVTIHQKNLQKLVTEIYKVKNNLAPELMKEVFEFIEKPYLLRENEHFKIERIHTSRYGLETPSFIGPKLWKLVPQELKSLKTLEEFKKKIKTWVPENCPCKLCKIYIQHIGFI